MSNMDLFERRYMIPLAEIYHRWPLDISLHAAEDEGRTEEPTEHKQRKAREEEGRVFLTQELPQAAVVLAAFSSLLVLSFYYFRLIKSFFIRYLENPDSVRVSTANIGLIVTDCIVLFLKIVLPLGLVSIVVVALTTMVQTGFHVSTKNLRFNFEKIVPSLENLRKKTIFSRSQLINTIKIFLKIFLVFLITYIFIRYNFPDIIGLIKTELPQAFSFSGWLIYKLIVIICMIFMVLAIPDYYFQKMEYIENLKMTKEEVKQEMKELEGNPEIKARQRERSRELATRSMIANVREADVVITNPEHFACAIRYDRYEMDGPKLIAKGMDNLAQRIKGIASEEGIPTVENVPLARSIYWNVEVNEFIPSEFFGAIAEIYVTLDKFQDLRQAG